MAQISYTEFHYISVETIKYGISYVFHHGKIIMSILQDENNHIKILISDRNSWYVSALNRSQKNNTALQNKDLN